MWNMKYGFHCYLKSNIEIRWNGNIKSRYDHSDDHEKFKNIQVKHGS